MNPNDTLARPASATPEKVHDRRAVAPPVDIFESEDQVVLLADMPGVKKEDVHLHYEKGQLSVEGRRELSLQGNVLGSELLAADYRRAFLVPQGIDASQITAELEQGVLRVVLPKSAALRPRRIEVKAG